MRGRCAIVGVVLFCVAMSSGGARAQMNSFALIIGNNEPPAGHGAKLAKLRYADDDAIRFYHYFKRITDQVYLLTVPDERSQKRYRGIGSQATPPTIHQLRRAVFEMSRQIDGYRREGRLTRVFVVFSGHGAIGDGGQPFLALFDGGLTRQRLFEEIFAKLKADYLHMFVDACYAEGFVNTRSLFDREAQSQGTTLTAEEMALSKGGIQLDNLPGVGVILSSTETNEAHEWSRIESGVFTHELLSGLAGPADVNGDGLIEYSELAAFVSSANRQVADSRGKLDVIAIPPKRNQNVAIVDLDELTGVAFLTGDPSSLGHFSIELANGQRYLDANLGGLSHTRIAVPLESRAFLRTATREAELALTAETSIEISSLKLIRRQTAARGGIDRALREGLFVAAYGRTYYEGFIDSSDFAGVLFPTPTLLESGESHPALDYRAPLGIVSVSLAGASLVTAGILGGLAYRAKTDRDSTNLERPWREADDRYVRYGNAAWIVGAMAPLAGIVAWLAWPDDPRDPAGQGEHLPAITVDQSGSVALGIPF